MNKENYFEIELGSSEDCHQKNYSIKNNSGSNIKFYLLFLLASIFAYSSVFLIGILPKLGYINLFSPLLLAITILFYFYFRFYIRVLNILAPSSTTKRLILATFFSVVSNLVIVVTLNTVFMFDQRSILLIAGRPTITLTILFTATLYLIPFLAIKSLDLWFITSIIIALAVSSIIAYLFNKNLYCLIFGISFTVISTSLIVLLMHKKIYQVSSYKNVLFTFIISTIFGIALYLAYYEAKTLVVDFNYLFIYFPIHILMHCLVFFVPGKILRGKNEKIG